MITYENEMNIPLYEVKQCCINYYVVIKRFNNMLFGTVTTKMAIINTNINF